MGLSLGLDSGKATILWPASGVGLAFIYLYGVRLLPGIFLGALLLAVTGAFTSGNYSDYPSLILRSCCVAVWPALQMFVSVCLLNRFIGKKSPLESLREVVLFSALAGPVGCLISATGSFLTLYWLGAVPFEIFIPMWSTWYLGDVLGVLIFAPAVIVLFRRDQSETPQRKAYVVLPLLVLFSIAVAVFHHIKDLNQMHSQKELQASAELYAQTLYVELRYYVDTLHDLREVVTTLNASDSGKSFDPEIFSSFSASILERHEGAQGVFWSPRVSAQERDAESSILMFDDDRNLVTRNQEDAYFPISFFKHRYKIPDISGLDLTALEGLSPLIERSIKTGTVELSTAPALFSADNLHSVFATVPVFQTDENGHDTCLGVISMVFRYDKTLSRIADTVSLYNMQMTLLFGEERKNTFLKEIEEAESLSHVIPVLIGDKEGYLVLYRYASMEWTVWFTLGVSIFITYLVSCFLLIVTGHIAVTQKIVARKTKELQESRNFLSTIMDHVPDALFVRNEKSEIIAANKTFLEQWSPAERSEIIGTTGFADMPDDIRERQVYLDRLTWEKGKSEGYEDRRDYRGNTRRMFAKKRVFKDEHDNAFIIGISRDMTEFLLTQNKMQVMFENTSEGVITLKSDGRIESYNKACEHILGYGTEDILGQDMRVFEPDVKNAGSEYKYFNLDSCFSDMGCRQGCEVYVQHQNGKVFPVYMSFTSISIGAQIFYSAMVRDISKEKEMEEELKRSNRELEAFAYIASHDLKAPLRHIAMSAEYLKGEYQAVLDEKGNEFLDILMTGSHRMTDMIESLLTYARVGQGNVTFEALELNNVLDITIDMLSVSIAETNAEITIEKDLPNVRGNSGLLVTLFQNLIDNAVKYQPDGQVPHVHISAIDDGEDIYIRICDNGIGIPPQYADKVFSIFQRLHADDEYQGSGVGLAISKRIVVFHGGEIYIDNTRDELGSCFVVKLPVEQA